MKGDKRGLYLELTKEIEASLCCFCKYGKGEGFSSICDEDGYYVCNHPVENLSATNKREEDIFAGDDCIGFQNKMKLPTLLEFVSLILSNRYSRWMYQEYPDHYDVLAERKEGEELNYYRATIPIVVR